MQWNLLTYIFITSSSLLLFWLGYQLFLAKLTYFNWQRGYLLFSLCFSFLLPFISIPTHWLAFFIESEILSSNSPIAPLILNLESTTAPSQLENLLTITPTINLTSILLASLLLVYLSGVLLKLLFFIDKLSVIRQLISTNPKEKMGNFWLIKLPETGTAFSFFHYIFLTKSLEKLSTEEVTQIKAHEAIHSQQKHSLDILLIEIAEIVLWFLPVIYWMKQRLKDIHEYLVDEVMVQQKVEKRRYAQLLLKLASPLAINSLTTGFTNKQIGRRINMLAKAPSASYHKLKFLLMLPIITSLLLFSACFGDIDQTIPNEHKTPDLIEQNSNEKALKIGTIIWKGNTIFSEEELNEALQFQTGDVFDKELLDKRLHWDGKGTDVSSLYMNNGYTYFKIEMEQIEKGEVVDLTFKVFEGVEVSIANIVVLGNKTVTTNELMSKIGIKKGEVFSRSKIIAAQKTLIEMGKFDPEKIGINTPILPENNQLMNIEFSVVELK